MPKSTPSSRLPMVVGRGQFSFAIVQILACLVVCSWPPFAAPQDAVTFHQLMREGHRFQANGNLRAASARFNSARQLARSEEELAEALVARAGVQAQLGHKDEAEEDLRHAIALKSAGVPRGLALRQLILLLDEEGRLDEAVALCRQVVDTLRDLPNEGAEVLIEAGRLLASKGRHEEVLGLVDQIPIDMLPADLRPQFQTLRIELLLGISDADGAQKAIEEAVMEPPEKADLYVRLARTFLARKRLQEAAQACQTALRLEPENLAAWRAQYDIALERGVVSDLRAELWARLEAAPQDETLIQRLVSLTEWDPNIGESLNTLRRLVNLRPRDVTLLERAGTIAMDAGRSEEALEFYEAALKLAPHDTGLHYMTGRAYAKLGQAERALELLKRGAGYQVGNTESTRRLGMMLIRDGLYEEAIRVYGELRQALGDPNALAYEMAEALAPLQPELALAEYVRAASNSLEEVEVVAPEALSLARNSGLLSRLEELTETAIKDGDTPSLLLLLATVQAARGSGEEAIARLVAAGLTADELLRVGETLEFTGNPSHAARIYEAGVRQSGTAMGLQLELAIRAAQSYLSAGQAREAEAVLRVAVAQASGPPELRERACFLLADLSLTLGGDIEAARATFAELSRQASQTDITVKAKWRLADCAFLAGDYDQATELYTALALAPPTVDFRMPPLPPGFPRNSTPVLPPQLTLEEIPHIDPRMSPAYAHFQIAECAFRMGDLEQAKALFAKVAEQYPDSVFANDSVERCLFISTHFTEQRPACEAYLTALRTGTTSKWEEAIQQLRGIIDQGAIEPLADDAAFLIAALLEAHGQDAQAATAFRELSETFPDSLLAPEALLNAARLARSVGDDLQAEKDLLHLLANSPQAPMAKTAALWLDDLQHGRSWTASQEAQCMRGDR
ncbi:MAG: tetratricopeptide repeat protein [Candidatus Zipacnadales bacterium]